MLCSQGRRASLFDEARLWLHKLTARTTLAPMEQWDQQQEHIATRAAEVRGQLGIDAELSRIGHPTLVGSAALRVMVARDIDLTVTVPRLDAQVKRAVLELSGRLSVRPDVREVTVRDDTGHWNTDPDYPNGLYLHVECVDVEFDRWSLDIWFVDDPERQPDLQHLRSMQPLITPETQAKILAIKRSTHGLRPDGTRLPSYEVYREVLFDGAGVSEPVQEPTMTEPVVRTTLLEQSLPGQPTASVTVRRIVMQPDVAGGPHHHNGPVFGTIESGSVFFQVDGGPETVLRAGDVFYEPGGVLIDRFDATSEGVTFLGYFLSGPGERPELTPGPPTT
jgi:quercetin dioxygenase-like cupin family protein